MIIMMFTITISLIILLSLHTLYLSTHNIDPNRVPDWSKERVSLFLRRLGLKQYVQVFYNYGVDGHTMILLDGEDYENLEVFNKVHIRKIQVEIMRIWKRSGEMQLQQQVGDDDDDADDDVIVVDR